MASPLWSFEGYVNKQTDRQTDRSSLPIKLGWFEQHTSFTCFIWKQKKCMKDNALYTLNIKTFVLYPHAIHLTHTRRVNLRAETSSADNTVLPPGRINKLYNSHKIRQISCVKQSAGWIYRKFFHAHILKIPCNTSCYQ